MTPGGCEEIQQQLMDFALEFPEAWVDYPWGDEPVVKVRKKIFAFLGEYRGGCGALGVKLPESADVMLMEPWAKPSSHGLGRSGWVTMEFERAEDVPLELLFELIEESYAAVAPKKLVAQAFAAGGGA